MIKQSLNEIFILFLYVLLLSKLPSWVRFFFSHVLMQSPDTQRCRPIVLCIVIVLPRLQQSRFRVKRSQASYMDPVH